MSDPASGVGNQSESSVTPGQSAAEQILPAAPSGTEPTAEDPAGEDGGSSTATAPPPRYRRPMQGPSADDVAQREQWRTYVQNSLAVVQASADKWQAGLAGFVSLVTAGLFLKGPETASDLEFGWRLTLTILLGGGLVAAVGGLWQALRAAAGDAGRANLDDIVREYGGIDAMQVAQANAAARKLGSARKLVALSLLLLTAGTVSWWWADKTAPSPAAYVQVVSPKGSPCGELTSADGGVVVLKVAGQSKPAEVPLTSVTNIHIVSSCQGG